MLGQNRQSFEVVILEALPGYAMTEEKPSDNPSARIKRHDHFRAEGIERTTKKRSLGAIGRLRETDVAIKRLARLDVPSSSVDIR